MVITLCNEAAKVGEDYRLPAIHFGGKRCGDDILRFGSFS
jgi:hypothetical protein